MQARILGEYMIIGYLDPWASFLLGGSWDLWDLASKVI